MNLVNKILIEGIDTMQMLLTLGQKFQKISPHQDNINKEDFQDCIMRCELFMKWINSKDFKIIVGEPIEDSEMDTMQLNLQKNKKFKKGEAVGWDILVFHAVILHKKTNLVLDLSYGQFNKREKIKVYTLERFKQNFEVDSEFGRAYN
mgnify:CR=1 FL=1